MGKVTGVHDVLGQDGGWNASRLLDLDGLDVQWVEQDASGGRVVHVATREEAASACPSCGVFFSAVKGRVGTRPRDIPCGTAALRLVWHKRRWRCTQRLCPRTSFTESVAAVPGRPGGIAAAGGGARD